MFENIKINNPERFSDILTIDEAKVALGKAMEILKKNLHRFKDGFAMPAYGFDRDFENGWTANKYKKSYLPDWTSGMWTGLYFLAYEITGDKEFLEVCKNHVNIMHKVANEEIDLNDHDIGFKFTPTCMALYKLTGDEKAKESALKAAKIQLDHYCPHNKFIIRMGLREDEDNYDGYRTLVDSMMNIPLFFWAYEETGDKAYYDAGVGHYNTTLKYLIREDGSSYHHYQFDPETLKPVKGVTWQGHRDESCWTRGHSWLVFGYPNAYRYTKDEKIFDIHRAVTYYFLNNLPEDLIPYWDCDFTTGSLEPRDSSAASVSVAGMLEMCKHLPDTSEMKKVYKDASGAILKSLIKNCMNKGDDGDGIILHVTGSKPHGLLVDTIHTYADYFFVESLIRYINPSWETYCW